MRDFIVGYLIGMITTVFIFFTADREAKKDKAAQDFIDKLKRKR